MAAEPTPEQVDRAWNLLGKIVGVLNEADIQLVARALAAERDTGWNDASTKCVKIADMLGASQEVVECLRAISREKNDGSAKATV